MKFCKHRVMDRCRKNGRPCTFSKECFEAEEYHETNADRIRAMSDEKLAKFLCDFRTCDSADHPCNGCKAESYCRPGHTGMIDWLQQPAEEDDQTCETCTYFPPSSCDGKPCSLCDSEDPMLDCYQRKEEQDG